jgi:hypothetical protein
MRWGLRVALLAVFLVAPCFAQTGTVTFYTYGASVKTQPAGTLPTVRPFTGWLFDGQQRLAHARDGRFVTFRLATGQHSFTARLDTDKPGSERVLIDVRDGKHYCIHLYSRVILNSALLFVGLDSRLEPVPCRKAAQELGKLKPLEAKRIDPAVLGEVDASVAFPVAVPAKMQ